MADIFISYKREDRQWAEALSKSLEAQGWSTWWDTRLAAGESFDEVIERELEAARCVVVLWSRASDARFGELVHDISKILGPAQKAVAMKEGLRQDALERQQGQRVTAKPEK